MRKKPPKVKVAVERGPLSTALVETRLQTFTRALELSTGNISATARHLGIVRSYATRLVREFGLGVRAKEMRVAAGAAKSGRGRIPGA